MRSLLHTPNCLWMLENRPEEALKRSSCPCTWPKAGSALISHSWEMFICSILKNYHGAETTQPFQTVDSTVLLSSDREKQFASTLQERLVSFKTCHGPAFALSLLKLKISLSSKFLHITFFWKLWTLLFFSSCFTPISPQLSGSAMCKRDTVPRIRLCRVEGLFHMFCHKSTKTPFYGVCLIHNSTTLLTRLVFPSIITPIPFLLYYLAVPSPSCICEAALCSSIFHPLFFS